MKKLTLFLSTALLAVAIGGPVRTQEPAPDKIVAVAEVVAYNLDPTSLVNLTSTYNNDVVLVRVNRSLSGDVKVKYLIVRYEHWTDESPLPREFCEPKSQWKLELRRDSGCDSSMTELLSKERNPGLVLIPGPSLNEAREHQTEVLPCYVLRPKGLTPYRETH